MTLRFERASAEHIETIFQWLSNPHMIEFWDNSQEHKDDILNFIHGRPQHYFAGTTQYWIGLCEGVPFSFLLSDVLEAAQDMPEVWRAHLSQTGQTVALDFGIGNPAFLGRGLAAPTLTAFMDFYAQQVAPATDTFFIDPAQENPRAAHVYTKAGFTPVGTYIPSQGAFVGDVSDLMVRRLG